MTGAVALILPRGGDAAVRLAAAAAVAARVDRARPGSAVVAIAPDARDLPPASHPPVLSTVDAVPGLHHASIALGVLPGDPRDLAPQAAHELFASLALAARMGVPIGLVSDSGLPPDDPAVRQALRGLLVGGGFVWTVPAAREAWRGALGGSAEVSDGLPALRSDSEDAALPEGIPGDGSWMEVAVDVALLGGSRRVLLVGGDPDALSGRLGPGVRVDLAAEPGSGGSGRVHDLVVVAPDAARAAIEGDLLAATAATLVPAGSLVLAHANGRHFHTIARQMGGLGAPTGPAPWASEAAMHRAGLSTSRELALDCGYGPAGSRSTFVKDGAAPGTRGRGRLYARTVVFLARPVPGRRGYDPAIAEAAVGAGRPVDALVHLDRELQAAPLCPEVWNDLGVVLHALGRVDDALQALVRAAEIDPLYEPAWQNLAAVLGGTLPEVDYPAQLAALPRGTPAADLVHLAERWVLARPGEGAAWSALAEILLAAGALHRSREVRSLAAGFPSA